MTEQGKREIAGHMMGVRTRIRIGPVAGSDHPAPGLSVGD
jgi:hypothetical protein